MKQKRIKSIIEKAVSEAKKINESRASDTITAPVTHDNGDNKLSQVVNFDIKSVFPIREDLVDWKNSDFAIYIKKTHMAKYKEDLGMSVVGIQVYLNRIKEVIVSSVGSCDNTLFKEYIDYFFDNFSDYFKNRNKGQLNVKNFKDPIVISKFVALYKDMKQHKKKENSVVGSTKFDIKQMEQSYLLGVENLILDYGIILSVNFLNVCQRISMKESANHVARSAYSLYTKNKWDAVCNATTKFSPYPDDLKFKKIESILDAINKKTNSNMQINISFHKGDNKEYDLLRSKK